MQEQPADQPSDAQSESRVFPCQGCGADLRFDIGMQKLSCTHCGYIKEISLDANAAVGERDFESMLEHLSELKKKQAQAQPGVRVTGTKELTCGSCGSTVQFTGNLTSLECAYCGTPIQQESARDAKERLPIDGVLPFAIERTEAAGFLERWVKSRWFAPNDFRTRGVAGKFSGIYLPFWTFDAMTFNLYDGARGEYYWVTVGTGKNQHRVRHTRWYPASGRFQRFFDDILIVATRSVSAPRLAALEPWPLEKLRPHSPEVIAGFLAKTYDVELQDGFVQAKAIAAEELEADVRRRIGGDTQRIDSIQTRLDAITFKLLLLPVWLMGYRFREKTYLVVVNAMTGEVQGDRPYSWVKILIASLAGAGALAAFIAIMQNQ